MNAFLSLHLQVADFQTVFQWARITERSLFRGLTKFAAGLEGTDTRHEEAGYAWLLTRFGSAVAEPVRGAFGADQLRFG